MCKANRSRGRTVTINLTNTAILNNFVIVFCKTKIVTMCMKFTISDSLTMSFLATTHFKNSLTLFQVVNNSIYRGQQ